MTAIEPEGTNLSRKQREAIPFLIGARSIEEGRRAAKVGQRTIHRWLKETLFRQALEEARERVVSEALERLKDAVTQAVSVLVDIMGGDDPVLRLRAAGMTLDHFFKIRELQELDQRLKRVEEALSTRREIH